MTRYVQHPGVLGQERKRFGQEVEVIAQVPQSEHYEDDLYRVRFPDGETYDVFPEELDPIPPAGPSYLEVTR